MRARREGRQLNFRGDTIYGEENFVRTRRVLTILPASALAAALVSCVHKPALSGEEECAMRGMVMAGVDVSHSSASAVAVTPGRHPVVARGSGYSETYQCREATSQQDYCRIRAYQYAAQRKMNYSTTGKNVAIGVGWVLYILPGLVLYIWLKGAVEDDGARMSNEGRWSASQCRPSSSWESSPTAAPGRTE